MEGDGSSSRAPKWKPIDQHNLIVSLQQMVPNFVGKSEDELMPQWDEVTGKMDMLGSKGYSKEDCRREFIKMMKCYKKIVANGQQQKTRYRHFWQLDDLFKLTNAHQAASEKNDTLSDSDDEDKEEKEEEKEEEEEEAAAAPAVDRMLGKRSLTEIQMLLDSHNKYIVKFTKDQADLKSLVNQMKKKEVELRAQVGAAVEAHRSSLAHLESSKKTEAELRAQLGAAVEAHKNSLATEAELRAQLGAALEARDAAVTEFDELKSMINFFNPLPQEQILPQFTASAASAQTVIAASSSTQLMENDSLPPLPQQLMYPPDGGSAAFYQKRWDL